MRTCYRPAAGAVLAAMLAFVTVGCKVPPAAGTGHDAAKPNETGLFKDNWPRFRGPDGTGVVESGDWPRKWDAETGESILWKTAVPAPGNSSPVLWGNRVFLTGADADRQEVFCFSRASGKLLWRTPIFAARGQVKTEDIRPLPVTGYASPTPATDGARLYATFASADIAAVDFDGHVLWARNLGTPEDAAENSYGRATSLLCYKDKVIVQFDRGLEPTDGLSAILALDGKTGRTVWSAPRPVRRCWCTPILVPVGEHMELVTNGSPWIIAYDPETGRELWRCGGMASDVACSPTFAGGLVFVTNENARVLAIRPGGSGDVTQTHVVWSAEDGMSDAASPVAGGKFFLQATSSGRITCYDAGTGKLFWDHLLGCAFWASPAIAGNLAYLAGDDGKVYILELGDKPNLAATCNLGEPLLATPAFGDDDVYFRGTRSLFCVGPGAKKP